MSQSHRFTEAETAKKTAKAYFDSSTVLDANSNWSKDKYQLDADGNVYVPEGDGLRRFHAGKFIGGVAYVLAEQGVIAAEEANPSHVALVSFELGKLINQHEAEIISVNPLSLVEERILIES